MLDSLRRVLPGFFGLPARCGAAVALAGALLLAGPAARAQAPTNGTCATATPLPVGTACAPLRTTNVGQPTTAASPTPGCSDNQGGDSWFSVVVPPSGNLRVQTSAAPGSSVTDTGLSVYRGGCGSLVELACNDDNPNDFFSSVLLANQTPGQTLLVRAWVYGNSAQGEYGVCAQEVPPCGAPGSVAVRGVRTRQAVVTFAENVLADGDYEVTYTPAGGPAQTATGSSSPITITGLTASTTYTVTVASTCGGRLTAPSAAVSFTTTAAPANDECAGAVALAVGTTCTPTVVSNLDASRSPGVADPSCADYNGDDMWYSVVVPANGIVALETGDVADSRVYDTGLAVYGGSCGSLTELICDDNLSHGYLSYARLTGLTPGTTLYVRVWSKGNYLKGDFTLCATTDDAAPVTEWLGTSHDWFAAANWSNGVPTASQNAHVGNVPGGNYPELTTAGLTAEVRNLVIDKYADFTHLAGTLAVSGHLICRANGTFTDLDNGTFRYYGGTVELRGSGPQQLTGLSEAWNLTLNGPGTTTLTSALLVRHQLTATQGVLSTGATYVDMGVDNPFNEFTSTARLSEKESSYVLGEVRYRDNVDVGMPADFGGLGLGLTADASSGNVPGIVKAVRRTGAAAAGVGRRPGITRTFALEPSNDTGLNLTMSFQYFAHERNGITDTDLGLYSATTPAGPWQLNAGATRQAPAAAEAPSTFTKTGLTHLSAWTLGSTAAPLPVELTTFTAEATANGALLRWTTASEKNSAYFAIEASPDGRRFVPAGTVAARGSAAHASTYEFRDANLLGYGSALVYYRLRQVDADETARFSPVRTVAAPAAGSLVATAFPVPFSRALTVQVRPATTGPAQLTLRDAWGRVLLRQTVALTLGTQEIPVANADQLPPGIYLLTIAQNGQQQQLKVSRE